MPLLRKRYFVLLQLLASCVGVVLLLAMLLPKQFRFLSHYLDALQLSWYGAILVLLISFAASFSFMLLCLWRKQLGQALKWLLVALLGLGLAFFSYSATTLILMGYMGDGGPADGRFHE